jgi:hypothetical protein
MEYDEKTTDSETIEFIQFLINQVNVELHGILNATELAIAYQQMDAFLICYDIQKDQSKGTNYHKVIEFLSTGKVIISNNVSTYKNLNNLLVMCESRLNNNELPSLFSNVIDNLKHYNSPYNMQYRRDFSLTNSYVSQIFRIEQIMHD